MARRRRHDTTNVVATEQPLPERAPLMSSYTDAARDYLDGVRNRHLNVRTDVARTIGELEAHRDEVEATIAFLKAQRS